jgi:hypothetical protein
MAADDDVGVVSIEIELGGGAWRKSLYGWVPFRERMEEDGRMEFKVVENEDRDRGR